MSHEELVRAAVEAIDAVFSDQSVSPSRTIDSLLEIVEHARTSIDAIQDDETRAL
jgi:hypothetical protein